MAPTPNNTNTLGSGTGKVNAKASLEKVSNIANPAKGVLFLSMKVLRFWQTGFTND